MKACVVLPTYNEAQNIRDIVARVLASTPDVDVLVVDDNSPDGTGKIADEIAASEPRVHVLHRPGKAGLGRAYIAGFHAALAQSYDAAIEMDSDFSHDPDDIPRLLAAAEHADVAIGSRWVRGGRTRGWSKGREALSRGANIYARAVLRFVVRDSTAGFRCYRRAVLETVPLDDVRSEGYAFQIEMTWRAWGLGFRIAEVPITFSERREGVSKMSRRIVYEAFFAVARWALRRVRAPRRPHPRSVARG